MTWLQTSTGALALLFCVGCYLARTHRTLNLFAALGVLMWAAHFASHGAWTACVVNVLTSLRVAAAVFVVHWTGRTRWLATVAAMSLTCVGAWLTWSGWTSAPSAAAALFLTYAGFHLHYASLRRALLAGEGLWLLNGIVLGSHLAVVAAILGALLNVRGMLRDRRQTNTPPALATQQR